MKEARHLMLYYRSSLPDDGVDAQLSAQRGAREEHRALANEPNTDSESKLAVVFPFCCCCLVRVAQQFMQNVSNLSQFKTAGQASSVSE